MVANAAVTIRGYSQDITITIDTEEGKRGISPNIYGRNNTFDKPPSFYQDAGLCFVRMNGGNNATKYNWRKKITSHPDWYNNVYGNDWDAVSQKIAAEHPDMQVMWAFQLLGRVASSTGYNFNDWEFNNSNWWEGVRQNLAGGGVPNTENPGGEALVEGDIDLYTEEWSPDSTVGILDHWFGPNGLGLDTNQFAYWIMDNEPDIWNGTHDDVMSDGLLPAEEFMDRFIETAKKARALYPGIKICGPVTTSEWQWYKWGNEGIIIDGKYYCWLEYFLKRIADEQAATGIRLLDVVDLHNYPYAPTNNDALQNHRMYYDKSYVYPGANGVKTINGGWDTFQEKEYIFQRINDWLDKYFGENHGITVGISEWSPGPDDPNLASIIYASHLGTFANHGVEYLTPWSWFKGMWETLHLFSRYTKNYSVSSTSSLENTVSAYTTVNDSLDSMTVIIVNRDMNASNEVKVNFNHFMEVSGYCKTLQLSSLPSYETFQSHTVNALKADSIAVDSNTFTITVPKLSTTAVLLQEPSSPLVDTVTVPGDTVTVPGDTVTVSGDTMTNTGWADNSIIKREGVEEVDEIMLFPNPVSDLMYVRTNAETEKPTEIIIFDLEGRQVLFMKSILGSNEPIEINLTKTPGGIYFMLVKNSAGTIFRKIVVIR